MTPAQLAALALKVDAIRFLSFEAVDTVWNDDGKPERLSLRIDYDGLPPEVRELIEAIPALLKEIERHTKGVSDEPPEVVG